MVLLEQGNGIQTKDWVVDEKFAPTYSRVYYMLGGEAEYSDNKITKKLDIGRLYIFPTAKKYKITHNPNSPINCLWLHLDLLPTLVNDLIDIPVQRNSGLYLLLHATRNEIISDANINTYFFSLVNTLIKYLYENKYLVEQDDEFSNILHYIQSHYTENISINETSQLFNYTPEHFIRMFQKKAGFTPYQYIINFRMSEAVRLLLVDTPVLKIAKHIGYSDTKTFSHAFRLKFGIPPTKYKLYYKPMA